MKLLERLVRACRTVKGNLDAEIAAIEAQTPQALVTAPETAARLAVERIAGVDIHPVTVIFARATYLLALMPALREEHPGEVALSVYLGDALQWNRAQTGERGKQADMFAGGDTLEIFVPAVTIQEPPRRLGEAMLSFPSTVAARRGASRPRAEHDDRVFRQVGACVPLWGVAPPGDPGGGGRQARTRADVQDHAAPAEPGAQPHLGLRDTQSGAAGVAVEREPEGGRPREQPAVGGLPEDEGRVPGAVPSGSARSAAVVVGPGYPRERSLGVLLRARRCCTCGATAAWRW